MADYRYNDSELYSCPINPKALELASFPFFWDVCDENAPFGSDEGYEALVHYWDWEEKNKDSSLEKCLYNYLCCINSEKGANELMAFCFIPYDKYLVECENYIYSDVIFDIWELDQYIVAIGLGSFVKYGEVHSSFKKHLLFALERMYKPNPYPIKELSEAEIIKAQRIYNNFLKIVEKI